MKKKKLIALVVAMLMVFTCIPSLAFAENAGEAAIIDSGKCGTNATWVLTDDWTLTISGTGELQTCPWNESALFYRGSIEKLVVEDGITSIPASAFKDLNITDATLPKSLTVISASMFNGCAYLANINIPEGVTKIETRAFYWCLRLENITIPESVTSISTGAFSECTSLIDITIPYGVKTISANLFNGCWDLESVTIPDSVTEIGECAFLGCRSLTDINIPDGVTEIGESAFEDCTSLTNINIPSGVNIISDYLFSGCEKLENVTIPKGVDEIGTRAFEECDNLRNIILQWGVEKIGLQAFSYCEKLEFVTIPWSVDKIGGDILWQSPIARIQCDSYSYAYEYAKKYGYKTFCINHQDEIIREAVEATCTKTGLTAGSYCSFCKATIIEQEIVPKKEHEWKKEYTIDKVATCTRDGEKSIHCEVCNARKDITVIEATEHNWINDYIIKEPGCTTAGIRGTFCSNCSATKDETKIDPLGHKPVPIMVYKKAGFNKKGYWQTMCEGLDYFSEYGTELECCGDYMEPDDYGMVIPAVNTPVISDQTFNNKVKTPSVIVVDADEKKLTKVTSNSKKDGYTLSYAKGRKNVGKYAVKVTLKGEQYSGSKTVYFKINPAGKSISKITPSKKAFTVKWSKPSSTYRKQMTGYQLQYSTSSKMTKPTKVTVKSTTATSKKISGSKVKAKKYYYVQLRTYKTVKGVKYYSSWSKVKKVKTK